MSLVLLLRTDSVWRAPTIASSTPAAGLPGLATERRKDTAHRSRDGRTPGPRRGETAGPAVVAASPQRPSTRSDRRRRPGGRSRPGAPGSDGCAPSPAGNADRRRRRPVVAALDHVTGPGRAPTRPGPGSGWDRGSDRPSGSVDQTGVGVHRSGDQRQVLAAHPVLAPVGPSAPPGRPGSGPPSAAPTSLVQPVHDARPVAVLSAWPSASGQVGKPGQQPVHQRPLLVASPGMDDQTPAGLSTTMTCVVAPHHRHGDLGVGIGRRRHSGRDRAVQRHHLAGVHLATARRHHPAADRHLPGRRRAR